MATTDPTTGSVSENYLIKGSTLTGIADAIRAKNGSSTNYKASEMASAISEISGSENIEWHQCPELVRNYLANVTYNASDYTTSQITNYAPATVVASNTQPIGKTIGSTTYYNQVPNVQTPFSADGKSGTLKPLDTCRWIKSSYASNVRDLGGWACDGGTIKYGLLYRGGEVVASDRDVLVGECGVRHELNLRGKTEANRTASPLGTDIWFTCPENFVWYSLTDKATWKEILECVFTAVTHNEPVYFHCSAGADRTGTVACILEALLGVSQSDIDKDYELTCFSTGTDTDANARRRNETDWTNLITAINGHSGTSFRNKVVNFVTSCGIPVSKINAFRAAMSTGTPETLTGGTHTITNTLTHISTNNSATSVEDQASYTAGLTAETDYAIKTVTITMGGTDISNCYSNGTITIPNVTGNVVITAVAEAIVYSDIQIYSPDGTLLNKKYSGTSVADENDSYLTAIMSLNLKKYRYLTVSGVYMSSYPGAISSSTPILYKIGYCKNGSVVAVKYSDNLTSTDPYSKTWVMDLSGYASYQDCDGIQIMIATHTGAAITSANVLTTDQLSIIASTKIESIVTHTITNKLTNITTSNSATSVNDGDSYSAKLTANTGYAIDSIGITMGGTDITTSAYSNGSISITKVTGDVVITATAKASVSEDVELYNPSNPKLNQKFSGKTIASGNGSYLVYASLSDLDLSKYKYLKVSGAYMSGYSGTINSSNPIFYKIGHVKSGSVASVQYTNNQAITTDTSTKEFVIDMTSNSNSANFSGCDMLIFMVMVGPASGSAITSSDVLTTSQLSIKASTTN